MATILVPTQATPATPTTGNVRIFVNTGGSLCSVDSAGTVKVYAEGVTTEQVQDLVGAMQATSATVTPVYNDAGNTIAYNVIPGGIDHNSLLNYVANRHIDHSVVSITAGTGLSGGGDLTTTRTLSMTNVGTAGTYRSVTTDSQGRVTAGTNPTTLAGYGITDAQPLDGDLTAVANLTGTGFVVRTAANTMTNRVINDGGGTTVFQRDGVSGNPQIDVQINSTTLDVSSSIGSLSLDLQGGAPAGTYGNATNIPQLTIDTYGRTVVATNIPVTILDFVNSPPPNAPGQFIVWNGSKWQPTTGGWTFNYGSTPSFGQLMQWSLSGSRWTPVAAPTANGQYLRWNSTAGQWEAVTVNAPVFGNDSQDFSDTSAFSSGSTTNVAAATFTTTSKPVGRYRIGVQWNFTTNSTNLSAVFGVYVDGVLQGVESEYEFKDTTDELIVGSFHYLTFGSETTHTIELRVRNESGLNTTVNRVDAEIWRVS